MIHNTHLEQVRNLSADAMRRETPLPLLITGVAGVPGYNALPYFTAKYPGQVVGVRQVNNWRMLGENIVACDVEDVDGLKRLFDQYQFKAVLNCGGSCALKSCEMDPSMAWRINFESVRNLLHVLEGSDTRLVQLSIDLVYSDKDGGGYFEHEPTDPVTIYGKTMAAAENLIQLERPETAILRISLPMGISFNGHAGAIDWIQSRFMKDKPATLYYDEIRTPTYTDCLNRVIDDMLGRTTSGIFHAGGPRRLSLYQIAQIINRVGDYNPKNLMGCMRLEAGPMPPRAGDVTMDSTKLADELGYDPFDPWPYHDCWMPTHHDWHHERPAEELRGPEQILELLYRNPRLQF